MHPLDLLFPKRCLGCGKIGGYFCRVCRETIELIGENELICPVCQRLSFRGRTHPSCRGRGLDGLISLCRYRGIISKTIRTVKFGRVSDVTGELMRLIPLTSYNMINELAGRNEFFIIAVPLHFTRKLSRGFNQSDYIARNLSEILGKPVRPDLLVRVRGTKPQAEEASRTARSENIKNAFLVPEKAVNMVQNANIVLVDDVATSGATMNEAARTLKGAGVKQVFGVSLAR